MNNVTNYLNDGANWQSRSVLSYLSSTYIDDTAVALNCGRYENGREQGYVFSARKNGKQRNYAVYEHRNSDDLCVVVNDVATLGTPAAHIIYDGMESKYDVTKSFRYGEIVPCGEWITNDITRWAKEIDEEQSND